MDTPTLGAPPRPHGRSATEHQPSPFVQIGMMAVAALAFSIVVAVVVCATAGG